MSKGSKGSAKYPHIGIQPTRTRTSIMIIECSCCDGVEELEVKLGDDKPLFYLCTECVLDLRAVIHLRRNWKLN